LVSFENSVLRRIIGPKRDEVTGGWRNLHREELHDLYSSPSLIGLIKVRRMRWEGACSMRRGEGECVFVGGKGRPRHRWVNNIRMDLVEVGWCDVDWIGLAQDRNRWRALCEFGIEPSGFI
jgi:hypothetical protein